MRPARVYYSYREVQMSESTVSLDGADRTIVGVVGDVHHRSLEAATFLEAYLPMAQIGSSYGELVIRTNVDPYDVMPAVQSAVFAVLPDVPLRAVKTMEEVVFRQTAQRRLKTSLRSWTSSYRGRRGVSGTEGRSASVRTRPEDPAGISTPRSVASVGARSFSAT
jgi:hypothetical protein